MKKTFYFVVSADTGAEHVVTFDFKPVDPAWVHVCAPLTIDVPVPELEQRQLMIDEHRRATRLTKLAALKAEIAQLEGN